VNERNKKKIGGSNKDMRAMDRVKVKEKIKRVWKDVTLSRDETLILFQPCAIRQRGRHRCLVVINFLLPLHMSTTLNLLILDIPTYG
jgi:hypothetical protein